MVEFLLGYFCGLVLSFVILYVYKVEYGPQGPRTIEEISLVENIRRIK